MGPADLNDTTTTDSRAARGKRKYNDISFHLSFISLGRMSCYFFIPSVFLPLFSVFFALLAWHGFLAIIYFLLDYFGSAMLGEARPIFILYHYWRLKTGRISAEYFNDLLAVLDPNGGNEYTRDVFRAGVITARACSAQGVDADHSLDQVIATDNHPSVRTPLQQPDSRLNAGSVGNSSKSKSSHAASVHASPLSSRHSTPDDSKAPRPDHLDETEMSFIQKRPLPNVPESGAVSFSDDAIKEEIGADQPSASGLKKVHDQAPHSDSGLGKSSDDL